MTDTTYQRVERVVRGTHPSKALVDRIKTSYRLALQKAPTPEDSFLWSMIGGKQADIHEALMSDDDGRLMALLSNPQETDLYYGVDILAKGIIAMMNAGTWIEDRWNDAGELQSKLEDLVVFSVTGCCSIRKAVPITRIERDRNRIRSIIISTSFNGTWE